MKKDIKRLVKQYVVVATKEFINDAIDSSSIFNQLSEGPRKEGYIPVMYGTRFPIGIRIVPEENAVQLKMDCVYVGKRKAKKLGMLLVDDYSDSSGYRAHASPGLFI